MLGRFVILASVAFSLLVAPVARAQEAGPTLDEIREMVLYARYREAIDAARQYVEREGLSARDRNAGLEVLATAQLATRDRTAGQTLERLYFRDPGHVLSDPGASPTVQGAFQRAREDATAHVEPEIVHEPPQLTLRRAPVIELRLGEDADAVDEIRVDYRQEGATRFTSIMMDVDEEGVARARLPLAEGREAYAVEYHIQTLAPSGAVLSSMGDASAPLTIAVPEATAESVAATGGVSILPGPGERPEEDEGGGVLSQWWFWTAVVLLVGGGVAAGILLTREEDQAPQGTLGTFTLGE